MPQALSRKSVSSYFQHLEFCQKYSAGDHVFFNSLLRFFKCDKPLSTLWEMADNKFIHISWKTMFALINCLTMYIFPFYMIIARVMHIFSSTSYHNYYNKIMFYSTQWYECHPMNDSYSVSNNIFWLHLVSNFHKSNYFTLF